MQRAYEYKWFNFDYGFHANAYHQIDKEMPEY